VPERFQHYSVTRGEEKGRGEKAAGASTEALKEFITGADLLIVVITLGGGTGSGAAEVAARQARECKVLSLFLVTMPFSFEGNAKFKNAEKILPGLHKIADAVICIPNDILFETISAHINMLDSFHMADVIIADCVLGMAELMKGQGMIRVDFAHVRQVLEHRDAQCSIGIGKGQGENRIDTAISDLIFSPILGGEENLQKADAIILTLFGGEDLSMQEATSCINKAKELLNPSAEVIVGLSVEPEVSDMIQLTVLCIRYPVIPEQGSLFTDTFLGSDPVKPAPGVFSRAKPRKGKKNTKQESVQDDLPFVKELSTGTFSAETPTLYKGENLDIPTYLRRSINIDAGD